MLAGLGVLSMWMLHAGKLGGTLVGAGLVIFYFGMPSQAARNGYID